MAGTGGKRPGAGRKPGSKVQRTADKAIEAAAAGIQPIEVVINVMRKAWNEGDHKTATDMAAVALPYTTPRLASSVVTHKDAVSEMSYEELVAFMARLDAATEAVEEDEAPPKPASLAALIAQGNA